MIVRSHCLRLPGRCLLRKELRFGLRFLAAVALVTTVSCASIKVVPIEQLNGEQLAPAAEPVAHVHAVNWGYYLFKFIPIVTGDLENPGYPQWPRFFRNNVTVEDVVDTVTLTGSELGGTMATDLQTNDKSGWVPWTLFFWLNEIQVSANFSKPASDSRVP